MTGRSYKPGKRYRLSQTLVLKIIQGHPDLAEHDGLARSLGCSRPPLMVIRMSKRGLATLSATWSFPPAVNSLTKLRLVIQGLDLT